MKKSKNHKKNILKDAFAEAQRREISKIPTDEQINWEPSGHFETKMEELVKKQNGTYKKVHNKKIWEDL